MRSLCFPPHPPSPTILSPSLTYMRGIVCAFRENRRPYSVALVLHYVPLVSSLDSNYV